MAGALRSRSLNFYTTAGEWGFLSNFYSSPIRIEGKVWPTTEHYFQAMKSEDEGERERVRLCTTPASAKREGWNVKLRPGWDSLRDDVMRAALKAKFEQHPELWKKLASTRGLYLVEHTRNDRYWADGGDGTGKNMLGKLLVELRDARLAADDAAAAAAESK